MVLTTDIQARIIDSANNHWSEHAHDEGFREMIKGKEPGHRMADYVDDRTTALLKINFDTRYEGDSKGSIKKRSMGDIWVHSEGIFNPINVKAGLQGMKGQPNVVSMQKLLDYLMRQWIDSYYLLIVKFDLSKETTHRLYLVDLLDWTEFITYDAGPGQIMLREQEFYEKYDTGYAPTPRSIIEKAEALFELFEDQVKALISNRKGRLTRQRSMLDAFQQMEFMVDQSRMNFVP